MRRLPNLRDERGFALVMALGSLVVLSIVLTVALEVSSSSSRHANRSNAGEKAYRLAEAGLNNAVAVIAESGADTTKVKPQPGYAGDVNATVQTLTGGTVTWGGTYDAATKIWSIKSIGSVVNPSGTGTGTITRTVTGKIQIIPPQIVFAAMNSTTEKHTLIIRSGGDLTVNNAIYVNTSNGDDGFDIKGTGGTLEATAIYTHGGWETQGDSGQVWVGGVQCSLPGRQFWAPTTGPGCPVTGAAVQADPFATTPLAPTPGAATCAGGDPYVYSPNQQLNAAVGNTTVTTIQSKGGAAIVVGDVIQIDAEQMAVTSVTSLGGGKYSLGVNRGTNGTTQTHASNTVIYKLGPGTATSPHVCTYSASSVTIQPGTYYGGICIGASDCTGSDNGANCTVTPPTFGPYAPTAQKTYAAVADASTTTVTSTGSLVSAGDTIKIDSEYMYVVSTADAGSGRETLTVQRGYLGSTADNHNANVNITKGTPVAGPTVSMNAGTYIIAGGGFKVCGSATLYAPNVMIYNTNDQVGATVYQALGQVLLNTSGSVTLGAQTTGTYAGMTIFQNRSLVKNTTDDCDHKAQDMTTAGQANPDWDIGFASMASTGANGSLGSATGTIYAANDHALFTDKVSGTAKLAVMTGCIYVDGSTSTFDFDAASVYGNGLTFLSQSG